MRVAKHFGLILTMLVLGQGEFVNAQPLTAKQRLGKLIYYDTTLSTPGGMSCGTCHAPEAGFADPRVGYPTSQGAIPTRFGGRNSPTSAYAAFSPEFHYDSLLHQYVGGQFWDGRASNLAEQAKGPLLNPVEMNNHDKETVIGRIRTASYDTLFLQVYGDSSLNNVEQAYDSLADAIASYEESGELIRFTSKYDRYLLGQVTLTASEQRGLALFNGRGHCSTCHPSAPGPYAPKPLFTNYEYHNVGVPRNPLNPFYTMPPEFNPDGWNWIDHGLGGIVGQTGQDGKMKVPTLRNIAVTPPFTHNGYFTTLGQAVHYYNKRDVCSGWPDPEVAANVDHVNTGNLGLMMTEENDIVAFLQTLTDGYTPLTDMQGGNGEPSSTGYRLFTNFPNPFNPETEIRFQIPRECHVQLKVFNALGQEVDILLDGELQAGSHVIRWHASGFASGPYYCRMSAEDFSTTSTMILLK